ncbi:MAG: type II toxin-antitoxin system RelE/ParE family toxin [Alphaproteobacteria bacterium]|nr:type II toxin-antitoxin system RelE/ParE family toxin [Alphaproteobacteria bacterium]
MRKFRVSFRPLAETDLIGLYDFIAEEAGPDVAGSYIARIEAACRALETFPARGTRRDDIWPGIRTIGFEHRATIVFEVGKRDVVVLRILYGGRDFARAFRN